MFKNANETDYNNKKSRHISNVYLLLAISFIPSFIGVLIGVPRARLFSFKYFTYYFNN